MMQPVGPGAALGLRSPAEVDVEWRTDMACDPRLMGPHNWDGVIRDRTEVERELRENLPAEATGVGESGTLVVELAEGTPIGEVSWRTERWGPSLRSTCPAFGVALLPQFRGRGYGTTAQRLLIDHLFESAETVNRVQSDTAVDNEAEQRSLVKAGMTAEGIVRQAEYRDGTYHDHILYSILRSEWQSGATSGSR